MQVHDHSLILKTYRTHMPDSKKTQDKNMKLDTVENTIVCIHTQGKVNLEQTIFARSCQMYLRWSNTAIYEICDCMRLYTARPLIMYLVTELSNFLDHISQYLMWSLS